MNLLLITLALCCALALLPEPPSQAFRAEAVTHTGTIRLEGPIQRVFPFFTPIGEKDWAEGWDPQPLYPSDGAPCEGMVFRTLGDLPMLWVATHYDAARHEITYVTVTHETLVRRIAITVREQDGATLATVTYTFTGLSPEGNQLVRDYTAQVHSDRIQQWEHAINHLLKTGHRLPHHG